MTPKPLFPMGNTGRQGHFMLSDEERRWLATSEDKRAVGFRSLYGMHQRGPTAATLGLMTAIIEELRRDPAPEGVP